MPETNPINPMRETEPERLIEFFAGQDLAAERLEALEDSTDRLTESVRALSGALSVMHQVQERALVAEARATEALATSTQVLNREEQIAAAQVARDRRSARLRRVQLRRVYQTIAAVVLLAVAIIYAALQLGDAHVESCLLHGPDSEAQQRVCDLAFPFHPHEGSFDERTRVARDERDQLLRELNSLRIERGLDPLTFDSSRPPLPEREAEAIWPILALFLGLGGAGAGLVLLLRQRALHDEYGSNAEPQ